MEQKLLYKAIKSNNEEKILEACDLIYQKYQKLIYFIIFFIDIDNFFITKYNDNICSSTRSDKNIKSVKGEKE